MTGPMAVGIAAIRVGNLLGSRDARAQARRRGGGGHRSHLDGRVRSRRGGDTVGEVFVGTGDPRWSPRSRASRRTRLFQVADGVLGTANGVLRAADSFVVVNGGAAGWWGHSGGGVHVRVRAGVADSGSAWRSACPAAPSGWKVFLDWNEEARVARAAPRWGAAPGTGTGTTSAPRSWRSPSGEGDGDEADYEVVDSFRTRVPPSEVVLNNS